MRKTTQ